MNSADQHHAHIGFREFVLLMGALMALNAMAIDAMLPALPQIGTDLHIANANDRQLVISVFMLGMGSATLFYGPLSDRFGRKPVLLIGIAAYIVCSLIAAVANSFALLLVARALHGVAAAAPRVVTISIIRDRFEGRQMARVMSLVTMIFIIVPVIAPSIGQFVTLFGSWRLIFASLTVIGGAIMLWIITRLPETLAPQDRLAITPAAVGNAVAHVLRDRLSLGYTAAQTMLFGALMGYLNSSQQIFAETFDSERLFPLLFGLLAAAIAGASYLNSKLVERVGMRALSHGALLLFVAVTGVHMLLAWSGHENLVSFVILQGLTMGLFSLAASNFNAMAMENMGAIAGTAASVQGCFATVGAALLGMLIGLHLDGTTRPLTTASFVFGLVGLAVVLWTERGRLFHGHHRQPAVPADKIEL